MVHANGQQAGLTRLHASTVFHFVRAQTGVQRGALGHGVGQRNTKAGLLFGGQASGFSLDQA